MHPRSGVPGKLVTDARFKQTRRQFLPAIDNVLHRFCRDKAWPYSGRATGNLKVWLNVAGAQFEIASKIMTVVNCFFVSASS